MDNRYIDQAEEIERLKDLVEHYAVLNVKLAKKLQLRDKQRISYRQLFRRYQKKYGDINNG